MTQVALYTYIITTIRNGLPNHQTRTVPEEGKILSPEYPEINSWSMAIANPNLPQNYARVLIIKFKGDTLTIRWIPGPYQGRDRSYKIHLTDPKSTDKLVKVLDKIVKDKEKAVDLWGNTKDAPEDP